LVKNSFERYITHLVPIPVEPQPRPSTLTPQNSFEHLKTTFAGQSMHAGDHSTTELDEYLKLLPEPVDDPILWWYKQSGTYPNLSCMALDYLSIPGKSFLSFTLFMASKLFLQLLWLMLNVFSPEVMSS
jgi:hypothetical protein